jgi:hypothetical protein
MAPILAESRNALSAPCRKNCPAACSWTIKEKDESTAAMQQCRSVLQGLLLAGEQNMSSSPSTREPLSPQVLRDSLLSTIDLLTRRRAAEIGDAVIDDYVALNWLEWNGGALRLTVVGQNIRQQLLANLERP